MPVLWIFPEKYVWGETDKWSGYSAYGEGKQFGEKSVILTAYYNMEEEPL